MTARVPSGLPYVIVTRGGAVESIHSVAACAVGEDGTEVLRMGDVDVPVFLRSAWKPFIAAEVVASGAAARFGFEAKELAVIAASHNGEPFHVAAVAGILARIGLDASALRCGAREPSYGPAARALCASGEPPSALHNNCSGKHAGLLAMCVHLGLDPAGYLAPSHPVQARVLAFCAEVAGDDLARMPLGVDGCGIPVLATPLSKAARAFARLASARGVDALHAEALRQVRDAMAAEPACVAGTGRFDTALLEATKGRLTAKGGAEGVQGCGRAVAGAGFGLALKVIDGSRRAAPPAALGLLRALEWLEEPELESLATFGKPDVHNVAGCKVGNIVAVPPDTFLARTTS